MIATVAIPIVASHENRLAGPGRRARPAVRPMVSEQPGEAAQPQPDRDDVERLDRDVDGGVRAGRGVAQQDVGQQGAGRAEGHDRECRVGPAGAGAMTTPIPATTRGTPRNRMPLPNDVPEDLRRRGTPESPTSTAMTMPEPAAATSQASGSSRRYDRGGRARDHDPERGGTEQAEQPEEQQPAADDRAGRRSRVPALVAPCPAVAPAAARRGGDTDAEARTSPSPRWPSTADTVRHATV